MSLIASFSSLEGKSKRGGGGWCCGREEGWNFLQTLLLIYGEEHERKENKEYFCIIVFSQLGLCPQILNAEFTTVLILIFPSRIKVLVEIGLKSLPLGCPHSFLIILWMKYKTLVPLPWHLRILRSSVWWSVQSHCSLWFKKSLLQAHWTPGSCLNTHLWATFCHHFKCSSFWQFSPFIIWIFTIWVGQD